MVSKVTSVLPLLFTSCLSQFAMDIGTHADMTFGEDNDRYDVDAILQDQSSMDMANQFASRRFLRRQNQNTKEGDTNKEDSKLNELNDKDKDLGIGLLEALKQTVDQMAENKGFADHDDMKPLPNDEGINEEEYEKNIQKFVGKGQNLQDKVVVLLGGEKSGRRGIPDPEHEILFRYGVPVKMKLNGFLQVPLNRK